MKQHKIKIKIENFGLIYNRHFYIEQDRIYVVTVIPYHFSDALTKTLDYLGSIYTNTHSLVYKGTSSVEFSNNKSIFILCLNETHQSSLN